MRILIADKLAPLVAQGLASLPPDTATVETDATLSGPSLTARIRTFDPEVLVVRSTEVHAEQFEAGRSLALVIRAGAGVNTIDLKTASSRGVYVSNCPGKNAAAVAELTIGHLINLDRRIADNVISLRAQRWDKKEFGKARGLRGRTLALLGYGQIGHEVAVRATALGLKIVAWSLDLTPARAEAHGIGHAATAEEAVAHADAVSVHLSLHKETRGIIGRSVFNAMRPGVLFINTSRGEVVDAHALLEALNERGLRAGLDVFPDEPTEAVSTYAHDLATHPNVYGTHHIGASTDEAEEAVGEAVLRIIEAHRQGSSIPNCCNLAAHSPATHLLVVRHADRVGVLAHVLEVLRAAEHNVQEMQNIVFQGAVACCARIALVGEPKAESLEAIRTNEAVYAVTVTRING
ncbi:MAG: hydroxyacid dehydrogenase [Myxococcales bacterium]|nr:hydroxyacid dehydrogenase [Myxococcales bacterium]